MRSLQQEDQFLMCGGGMDEVLTTGRPIFDVWWGMDEVLTTGRPVLDVWWGMDEVLTTGRTIIDVWGDG